MTFQFLCPQGHLLQGEESQMGQPCNCPMCGTPFLIPQVNQGGAAVSGFQESVDISIGPSSQPDDELLPSINPLAHLGSPETPATGAVEFEAEPKVYHIPCPNGHELETPDEMLNQEVLCPFCGVQFRLRFQDSVEHKRQRAAEQERKELKAGKMWFNWAIVAAVIVVLGMVIMVAVTLSSR